MVAQLPPSDRAFGFQDTYEGETIGVSILSETACSLLLHRNI